MKLHKLVVVQIAGKAGQGKSTTMAEITKEIVRNYPKIKVKSYSYGAAVKQIANETLEKMGVDYKNTDKELIRPMYQMVGMMARELNDRDHWLNVVANKIKADLENEEVNVAIIDDARFVNELERFDDVYEVIKIKMDRPSSIANVNPDSSETGLDNYPIENYDILVQDAFDPKQIDGIVNLILERGK